MKTLSRPMFNMGGPIKQGVMHGIREPYKGGGKAALVGNPVYPKTGGREHHFAVAAAAPWAMRGLATLPKIWRGMKAAKTFDPALTGWSKLKNIFPSGRFRDTAATIKKGAKVSKKAAKKLRKKDPEIWGAHQGVTMTPGKPLGFWKAMGDPTRLGAAIRQNPLTAGTIGYTALGLPRKVPDILSTGADVAKWGGRKIREQIFGDLFKDPEPSTGVTLPGGGETAEGSGAAYYSKAGTGIDKPLTKAQQEKWADAQRGKRLNNLLDIMGYDRSKKTAIADALIDASKIVSDRGTLDRKNITRDLINPIIQATSKRLDKPDQIREAVGLMMAKGEIEKDLYKWKPGTHLKNAQDMADTLGIPLEEAFNRITSQASTLGEEMQGLQVLKKGTALTNADVEKQTRVWADKKKKKFKKNYTATDIKEAGLDKVDAVDIVSESITGPDDDGYYVIGTEVVEVINGVPKRAW